MANFKIFFKETPSGQRTQEVEADHFTDNGDFIDFYEDGTEAQDEVVLRVSAASVSRIERAKK
jgi:hypothetical protein